MSVAAIGIAFLAAPTADAASMQSCPRSIVSCGCAITSAGYYQVDATLSAAQGLTSRGECIDVKAGNVILNLASAQISGPGSTPAIARTVPATLTIGLHVQPGSNNNYIEGAGAMIEGWSVGIEVEGAQNLIEFFNANRNDAAGVMLQHALGNNLSDFSANENGAYGVWLEQSTNNSINCSNADDNGAIGVYLGCADAANAGLGCRRSGSNSGNRLFNMMANSNGAQGVVLDSGTRRTIVSDVSAQANPFSDLSDQTVGCGSDLWFDNSFGSVNQGCVDGLTLGRRGR